MLVVVQRVSGHDVLEVAAAEYQQPVEALAADAADPALGVGARLRRSYRRFDDANAFAAEDLVELARELAVVRSDRGTLGGSPGAVANFARERSSAAISCCSPPEWQSTGRC
jgi:hypothetical protein